MNDRVAELLKRGVVVPHPDSVYIDEQVDPDHIAAGVVIHPGCRLTGASTSIGPDSEIGEETPATVASCQLGHGVRLKGGYFHGSVFLDGASVGSAAHIRPGTLMEEGASAAHANGFKQTILFPFVTTGSLVNFCDCLMAGGCGPKRHSEVGSSYVHFNFTPHGDKATPSQIGDVPRGVFLDRQPIFLGGQGGLVGPLRIAYGTVLGAGSVQRASVLEEDRLVLPGRRPETVNIAYPQGVYREVRERVARNLDYLGNLFALCEWYQHLRGRFMKSDLSRRACHRGARLALVMIIQERVKWLERLAERLSESLARIEAGEAAVSDELVADHRVYLEQAGTIVERIKAYDASSVACSSREELLGLLPDQPDGAKYVATIQALPESARLAGSAWLQSIVDGISGMQAVVRPRDESAS